MPHDLHHEHLIKELTEQLKPIFTNSPQGIYLYLDDTHKSCNKKFADMLGYKSIEEWEKNEYPVGDVIEEDQEKVIQAYMNASEKFIGSKASATCVRKDGEKIHTEFILVPISYREEIFVLHFVTQK